MHFSVASLLLLFSTLSFTQAVLYGDENYASLDGNFWAFYAGGIAVIDPETCTITKTIEADATGKPLPEKWWDGVYMQYHNRTVTDGRRLHDGDDHKIEGYILINSGVDRDSATGDSVSDIYVISTTKETVASIVEVGPKVIHSYGTSYLGITHLYSIVVCIVATLLAHLPVHQLN